jgi:hypothetical protein
VAAGRQLAGICQETECGGYYVARQTRSAREGVGDRPDGLTQELAANTVLWQPIVKATGYKITN